MLHKCLFSVGFISVLGFGCGGAQSASPLGNDGGAPSVDAAPASLADSQWGVLQPWQTPIADYIAAAGKKFGRSKLHKSIDDLMVFDDRLYLGYGDGSLNAGEVTPIQIRSWMSPDDAAPTAEAIAGVDDKFVATKASSEEEIAFYRRFGDKLYIPGVDAMQDDFIGNVFDRALGGGWIRHRTVQGGVHVQDIAEWHGDLYACGSGTLNLDQWNTGMEHAWVRRSQDGGSTFSDVADEPNPEIGDRRFTALLPLENELYAFGYATDENNQLLAVLSQSWDGNTMSPSDVASKYVVFGAESFSKDTGVLRAATATGTSVYQTLLVKAGKATPVEAVLHQTVLDISVTEPGKALLLATAGDAIPLPPTLSNVDVLYTEDLVSFKTLFSFAPPSLPTAIAAWRGTIYIGFDDGSVWRSVPNESVRLQAQ